MDEGSSPFLSNGDEGYEEFFLPLSEGEPEADEDLKGPVVNVVDSIARQRVKKKAKTTIQTREPKLATTAPHTPASTSGISTWAGSGTSHGNLQTLKPTSRATSKAPSKSTSKATQMTTQKTAQKQSLKQHKSQMEKKQLKKSHLEKSTQLSENQLEKKRKRVLVNHKRAAGIDRNMKPEPSVTPSPPHMGIVYAVYILFA